MRIPVFQFMGHVTTTAFSESRFWQVGDKRPVRVFQVGRRGTEEEAKEMSPPSSADVWLRAQHALP